MSTTIEERAKSALRMLAAGVVEELVEGEIDNVCPRDQADRREIAAAIESAIAPYGQSLVLLPEMWWQSLDVDVRVDGQVVFASGAVRLWTEREAPSDLVIDLSVSWHIDTGDLVDRVLGVRVVPFAGDRTVPPPQGGHRRTRNDWQPDPSDRPIPERWRPKIAEIVHRLVQGDANGLVEEGLAVADPPGWIEEAIRRHGVTLVELPPEAWSFSDHDRVVDGGEAILTLWSEEEGPSSLSMRATVWDDGVEEPVVRLDLIEVM